VTDAKLGWKSSFYIFAFIGLIWCAAWKWYGRDRPEQHSRITKEELALIKSDQDSSRHGSAYRLEGFI
jgi:predicted MFS family arabinose efflux permease